MRLRGSLAAICAVTVMLVWSGCDETSQVEQLQGPSSFAKSGPPPAQCDVKGLPVKDYFLDKATARNVSGLLRDLKAHCVDENGQEQALRTGFLILRYVETQRGKLLAAGVNDKTVFEAGGKVVARVWVAMQYDPPEHKACPFCAADVSVGWEDVARALQEYAFGVRGVSESGEPDPNDDRPVVSVGSTLEETWGIELEDGKKWKDVLPANRALIYGYAIGLGTLGEKPLSVGFDWHVVPWWPAGLDPKDVDPLLVGNCAPSSGANSALIAHEPIPESSYLLPAGPSPSYCRPEQTNGWGQQATRLASLLVPIWPKELNASLMVGKSGSGKAREFSPFNGYDIPLYADTKITQPKIEDFAFDKSTGWSVVLSFIGFDDPANLAFAFDWTTPKWTDESGVDYGGNDTSSLEWLLVSAVENNGATVKLAFSPKLGCYAGGMAETPASGYGQHQILCECDGRPGATNSCEQLELTGLKLNKSGVYRLCVGAEPGAESSSLIIEACTDNFHVKPNPQNQGG